MHITVIASEINRHAIGVLDDARELNRAARDGRAAPLTIDKLRKGLADLFRLAEQFEAAPVAEIAVVT